MFLSGHFHVSLIARDFLCLGLEQNPASVWILSVPSHPVYSQGTTVPSPATGRQSCFFLLLPLRWGKGRTGTCAGTLLQPLPEGEVGHDTGVFDTHVCNRVGGVVVVVVGGSI